MRPTVLRPLLVLAVTFGAACEPPDRPSSLPPDLALPALAFLRPDTTRVIPVTDGVVYRYLWSPEGPWAVHLLEVDLRECRLGFEVASAPLQEGMAGGRSTVTRMVAQRSRGVLAAVNGDFFTPEGTPVGPEVSGGVRRTGVARPALATRGAGDDPWIGVTGVSADRVEATGWPVGEGAPGTPVEVIGGYPELLDEGRRVGDFLVEANPSFAASRHPRTAVGYDPGAGRFWLVVVDGRQGEYSTGMSLPELTTLLEALGAREALNLDGGGSSVMLVRGRSVSRPSDGTGERPVVNALLVVDDPARCAAPLRTGSERP